jgi:hypothetical protein
VKSPHGEQDQLLRIFHREQTQEDLVEQSEDGGIRSNAEGERDYRNDGEDR